MRAMKTVKSNIRKEFLSTPERQVAVSLTFFYRFGGVGIAFLGYSIGIGTTFNERGELLDAFGLG